MPPKRDQDPGSRRVDSRAESLTSDELEAGSDDPHAQADAILTDSDARADDRESPPGKPVESGQSDDNVPPDA